MYGTGKYVYDLKKAVIANFLNSLQSNSEYKLDILFAQSFSLFDRKTDVGKSLVESFH